LFLAEIKDNNSSHLPFAIQHKTSVRFPVQAQHVLSAWRAFHKKAGKREYRLQHKSPVKDIYPLVLFYDWSVSHTCRVKAAFIYEYISLWEIFYISILTQLREQILYKCGY